MNRELFDEKKSNLTLTLLSLDAVKANFSSFEKQTLKTEADVCALIRDEAPLTFGCQKRKVPSFDAEATSRPLELKSTPNTGAYFTQLSVSQRQERCD